MNVRTQTELSHPEKVGVVRPGCPPSLGPLRESVAKVCKHTARKRSLKVPVIGPDRKPLMPTSPKRARKMIESGKATPFWSRGIFCIRLNVEPSGRNVQPVVVGIDPGSKREGISIISEKEDFLHIQLHARTQVKKKIKNRRDLRRGRRSRNTPCRQPRWNRGSCRKKGVPPSTKARWGWKLNVVLWLACLYPVSSIVVEDVKARTKGGQSSWNRSFSPLEVGKKWFYNELEKVASVTLRAGYETKKLREKYGLVKTSSKLDDVFEAHCVDSWVLAASLQGLNRLPTTKSILCLVPLNFRLKVI